MEQIRQWLNNGGTYQDGVTLLLQHTTDPDLHELFQETESDFKRKLLKDELKALVMQQNQMHHQVAIITAAIDPDGPGIELVATVHPAAVSSKPVYDKTPGRWSHPDKRDVTEKTLHDEWHPLFLEMQLNRSRIYDVAKAGVTDPEKKKEACLMAHRILQLARQCKQFYAKRDHYFKHGKLPYEPPTQEEYAVEPIAALKDLENRKRYVRTQKQNLAKNPNDETAKELLTKHLAAIEHYKALLNIK